MNMPLVDQHAPVTDATGRYQVRRQLELFRIQEDPHLIYRGDEHLIVLRYLQRRVAARPSQLRNHIRRVYLAIQTRESAHLTGALVDLMLVLKGRGRYLLNRMLEQSGPLLRKDHLKLFETALLCGDLAPLRKVEQGESILSNGGLPSLAARR
jgi:hypothetical protein